MNLVKKMSFRSIPIILMLFVCSCRKPLPHLEGIDKTAWKRDKNACMGLRSSMGEAIDRQKEKLWQLSETQILSALGHPDKSELYKRNKKLYVYYLEPSRLCKKHADSYRALIIRFNAVGVAQEVFVRNRNH